MTSRRRLTGREGWLAPALLDSFTVASDERGQATLPDLYSALFFTEPALAAGKSSAVEAPMPYPVPPFFQAWQAAEKPISSPLRHDDTREHQAHNLCIHSLGAARCLSVLVARSLFQQPARKACRTACSRYEKIRPNCLRTIGYAMSPTGVSGRRYRTWSPTRVPDPDAANV